MANKETVLSVTLQMIRALLQELIDRIDSGRSTSRHKKTVLPPDRTVLLKNNSIITLNLERNYSKITYQLK